MNIFKNKKTRVFILIMSTLVICAIVIAKLYYDYQNRSIDPRIVEANKLYSQYNDLVNIDDHNAIFELMDSIEFIYKQYPHYSESYEVGVLYNNRAATYLSIALSDSLLQDSLFPLVKENAMTSIEIYSKWLNEFEDLSEEEITDKISPYFNEDDPVFEDKDINRFIRKRVKQIKEAQHETPRRLSVSHTNLGIVLRHQNNYEEAIEEYFKALELWPDNLAAENNLSILLGQPLKKRSIIRQLFPKDRITE